MRLVHPLRGWDDRDAGLTLSSCMNEARLTYLGKLMRKPSPFQNETLKRG